MEQHTGLDYGSFFEGLTRRIARCARRGGFAREDFFSLFQIFVVRVQTMSRDAREGRKENDRLASLEALRLRARPSVSTFTHEPGVEVSGAAHGAPPAPSACAFLSAPVSSMGWCV